MKLSRCVIRKTSHLLFNHCYRSWTHYLLQAGLEESDKKKAKKHPPDANYTVFNPAASFQNCCRKNNVNSILALFFPLTRCNMTEKTEKTLSSACRSHCSGGTSLLEIHRAVYMTSTISCSFIIPSYFVGFLRIVFSSESSQQRELSW